MKNFLPQNVYNKVKTVDPRPPKLKLNDPVRISKFRTIFHKGYYGNQTKEIFCIRRINEANSRTYLLQDAEKKIYQVVSTNLNFNSYDGKIF